MLLLHTGLFAPILLSASTAHAEDHAPEVFVDPKGLPWSLDTSTPCTAPCTFHLPATGMHRLQIGDVHEDVWISERTEIRYQPRVGPVFYTGAVMTTVGAVASGLALYALLNEDDKDDFGQATMTGFGVFIGASIATAVAGAILMIVTDQTLHVQTTAQPSPRVAPDVYRDAPTGPLAIRAPETVKMGFSF